jgi:succinate-semialdehyde dehydrogenase/glutarate-semialdehyde dehydrogenase
VATRIGTDTGNFWQPTVLTGVPLSSAKHVQRRTLWPRGRLSVALNTLDEAIAEANRLPFGLAGYAFTKSLKNADLLARKRLEVGMMWINQASLA